MPDKHTKIYIFIFAIYARHYYSRAKEGWPTLMFSYLANVRREAFYAILADRAAELGGTVHFQHKQSRHCCTAWRKTKSLAFCAPCAKRKHIMRVMRMRTRVYMFFCSMAICHAYGRLHHN